MMHSQHSCFLHNRSCPVSHFRPCRSQLRPALCHQLARQSSSQKADPSSKTAAGLPSCRTGVSGRHSRGAEEDVPASGHAAPTRRLPQREAAAAAALRSEVHTAEGCSRRALYLSLAALLAGGSFGPSTPAAEAVTLEEVSPPIVPAGPLTDREQAIIDIFERTAPAVVNIFDNSLQAGGRLALSVDSPEGNGTGFIWDGQGHVVTNYHVLGSILKKLPKKQPASSNGSSPPGPKVARVALLGADGFTETYDGYLVGTDRSKDLAVLKIYVPEGKAKPVQLGESSRLRVGQQCLAVGNPFGFDHSLSTGVISGLNRDINSPAGPVIPGGIQSDAAINPGNSGGPMLDSSGRVVGINTAIFTNTGASAGIGFAIPIDTVRKVVPQLIQYGQVVRPSLNIQVASDQVAASLKVKRGALVQSVPAGSAAAKAGLLPTRRGLSGVIIGDIITKVDDRPVGRASDLANSLDEFNLGQQVMLTVHRGENDVEISLVLEEGSN